jgi:Tol biopolymer transport system component/DNA-binding winged helix-turn-helix (wHTH) protein
LLETKLRRARFSVFEADLERHELRKNGLRIKLTDQPFQALALLLEDAGEIVTRGRFREALWPSESWGDHDQRLNRIMNKIREALNDSADTPRFVETIPRVGYRFLADVDRQQEPAPGEAFSHTRIDIEPIPAAINRPPLNGNRIGRLPWILAAGVIGIGVLAVGLSTRVGLGNHEKARALNPVPLTTYVGSELHPALSPDARRVAFAWDGESKDAPHIYTASTSGGGARQLTNDAASDVAPAWSSDGQKIAFLRNSAPGVAEIWTIHADGSGPVKLREIQSPALNPSLTWTHDQKWLIVSQRSRSYGVPVLFRISTSNGEETQITSASAGQFAGDMSPAVSPDGSQLAFTRSTSPSWRDIFAARLSKDGLLQGEPVRLTDRQNEIDYVAWAPDGKSLIFSAAATAPAPHRLFRVEASSGSTQPEITDLGIEGDRPTLAGTPFRLAYVRTNIEQSSVWRLDRNGAKTQRSRLMSSTRRDFTTALSPDGQNLVFSSIRSGQTEIWMSRTDGSNLRRLTSGGGKEPRWSPDGKRVVFVSSRSGQSDIYVLSVDSGSAQRLTSDAATHLKPSWSRDGRYIYFSSDRTGRPQIWKAPVEGGDPLPITRRGALYAVESFDGKSIYFTTDGVPAEVWQTTVNGGEETPVLRKATGHAALASGPDGLYYFSTAGNAGAQLDFYRFADRSSQTLALIDRPVHGFLSSSWDGQSVLYTQIDSRDHDLMLVDPYR